MYCHITGITLQELRDELLAGTRLPPPQSCPSKMCRLIQRCCAYEANDRPSFGEIKKMVVEAYEELELKNSTSTEIHESKEEVLEYADLTLHDRYVEMKIKNNDYQQNKNQKDQDASNIVLDVKAGSVSYKTDENKYLSMTDHIMVNHIKRFRHRRSSSYCGADPTPLLQPERLPLTLTRAQTSPNPMYMLNLSNREAEKLAIDEIFKRLKSLD